MVMPFGLKNVGATYQRLVNHMFRLQIGQNVEVHVDDMLVKSLDEERHLEDLQETFEMLRRYKMKLNPSKCAFGVLSGKFLGHPSPSSVASEEYDRPRERSCRELPTPP